MSVFAEKLIAWQQAHGRHDLPWQQTRDPYAVWVSEIMLQQTQVSAVIAYYQRFMQRFPTIASLAQVEQDDVMQYWSGLGYYSRARNLHHAARAIMHHHGGVFPTDFDTIQSLKGIGRSTAAAISVFAFDQRQTILDGNVKRVLARLYAIEGWPGLPEVEKKLWQLAEQLLPKQQLPAYVQGLMDFGATLCTRSKPRCHACPMQSQCLAYQQQKVALLPTAKPRKALPEKQVTLLMIVDAGEILLERRPNHGIWGGLWSLPELSPSQIAVPYIQQTFGLETEALEVMPVLWHSFTHFKLEITPQPLQLIARRPSLPPHMQWLTLSDAIAAALPTPVRTLIKALQSAHL
ncbi:A/G-specific adenine glycosylase [Methylophilus medardicus]|uniref:Adenine DNA glycosylase n=1 Tax=Methylophilus medardicus TaxID=2588534 RepID=A0A5B8CW58_9PROT|nr:A/G-specific adenine glycosylase [Methylophilus medardicus]QDC45155.1 A/G-specific adenine glycosylase [Methylophilus medardicus]QDC50162.1 A/G-specific adenine glycosylase [Methylophilus medardicus]QDC53867.1 A/G-specific adenine glycosylase [Methylophilus medardicus]